MANLAQTRDRVDAWLAARWPTVQARQNTYFANKGKYWQGLRTHNVDIEHTPSTDGDAPPDNLDSAPTDQGESWLDVLPELSGVSMPMVFWSDVYDGPDGQGYAVTVWVKFQGDVYSRTQNVGPETWRTQWWQKVDEVLP